MIMLTEPTQIHLFDLARTISALRIEVRTGMVMSKGSLLKKAQQTYGVKARTKAGALEELQTLYFDHTGRRF